MLLSDLAVFIYGKSDGKTVPCGPNFPEIPLFGSSVPRELSGVSSSLPLLLPSPSSSVTMTALLSVAVLFLLSSCAQSSGEKFEILSLWYCSLWYCSLRYCSLWCSESNWAYFVTHSPSMKPFSSPPRVTLGSTVTVTCSTSTSTGRQPLSFHWLKDGLDLSSRSVWQFSPPPRRHSSK